MTPYTALVVDDDLGTRETFSAALHLAGFSVVTAASGADALAVANATAVHAAVLDLRLPDMSGLEVARHLQSAGHRCPFVLVSGFLTTAATVEAMRLGALDVLDKPITTDDVCRIVARALEADRVRIEARSDQDGHEPRTKWGSTVARWTQAVVRACESDDDPRTLHGWALQAAMSYTSLRELCDLLAIKPHEARDFARVLRAVVLAHRRRQPPRYFLDVADLRTMRRLFERAGFDPAAAPPPAEIFCDHQRFIDPGNPGVRMVRRLLAEAETRQ